MLTIYGIKNCNTMKKAFDWLDEHHIEYQFHNYKTDGLNEQTLNALLKLIDWQTLLNNKGMTWRKLSEEVRASITTQAAASKIMLANPSIIKRPVIIDGERFLVGFSESTFQQFFENYFMSVIELTKQLIAQKSVSPDDKNCQKILIERLVPLGFTIEEMNFNQTKNFWAYHGDKNSGETIMFAGHTDVVPAGDETKWRFPPYVPTIDENGHLYGRGSTDMKSGVAAMICAAQDFVKQYPNHNGRIAFLITSDEEADATDGTIKVVEELIRRKEKVDYCIVGEPSSEKIVGDQIKNGRRGSLTANLVVHGVQGHVAYPHLADNPVHRFAPALNELVSTVWDNGNQYFPPTSMQVANINGGTGAENVIPGDLKIQFNFRFSSELTADIIKQRVEDLLQRHKLNYTLKWRLSGNHFLTPQGKLTEAAASAIKEVMQIKTELSTSGGTSDGRFIAQMGCQVIELGVTNATIHKVNEHVHCNEVTNIKAIYQRILEKLLLND